VVKKYRKKPVVIEAVEYNPFKQEEVIDFIVDGGGTYLNANGFFVVTLEGQMRCSPGDFIIKGIQGEFYACKPDIFAATYEEVVE
jgi:hypothetical protein